MPLFETSYDPELIAAYVRQGITLDALPYTQAFEALYEEASQAYSQDSDQNKVPTRAELFHLLHNLRKAGRLPRLGRSSSTSTPRIAPEHEELLVTLVNQHVGELSKRDQLLYEPAFDEIVQAFNEQAEIELPPELAWRIIAKLAKRPTTTTTATATAHHHPSAEKQDESDSGQSIQTPAADDTNPTTAANAVYHYDAEHTQVSEGFVDQASVNLRSSAARIQHCVNQLTDEQIWYRPHESMNAIGNLLLHLCGNLDQWIISGVTGTPCHRNRQAEFDQRTPIEKDELLANFNRVIQACDRLIHSIGDDIETADDILLAKRQVQGFKTNVLTAVFHAVCHLDGHAQEIICLTRTQLGDDYQFLWQPSPKQL